MTPQDLIPYATIIDPHTSAFILSVPKGHVVLLQAFFELYEGIGTVRTVQDATDRVCVYTSPSTLETCAHVLVAIKKHVDWRVC